MGFENTFYSIPEAITLGAWTCSRPFPASEISPKREILNSTMKWFWRFLIARSEQTNNISWQISMVGFDCVAKNIEGWFFDKTSYLVYSQICLNLPKDDCHFLYIFQWMRVPWARNKSSWKQILMPRTQMIVDYSIIKAQSWTLTR